MCDSRSSFSLRKIGCKLLFVMALVATVSAQGRASQYLVYVGTYTDTDSRGIYAYRFDSATGDVVSLGLAAESENPSFLAAAANGRFLYAVNEVGKLNGQPGGGVSAFAIDRGTGKLKLLNQVSSLGAGPAHISLDQTSHNVLIANYDAGSIAVFPIEPEGKLGQHSAFQQQSGSSVNKERQEGPHAHAILTSKDNRFVLSADLGADKVFVYRFDSAKGTLSPNDPAFVSVKAGSGPRHLAFGRSGKFLYLAEEMTGAVDAFAFDSKSGTLTPKQTVSALSPNFDGENTEAEIVVDPAGKTLYVSNRGEKTNDITVFRIKPADGTLEFVQRVSSGGKTPRNFAIDPSGKWLFAANQDSNNIQVFGVDGQTGQLSPKSQISGISKPVCVVFVPVD
jgi:6-phosphogluconolactonase